MAVSTTRRILTLHSPIRPEVLDQLLSSIEAGLRETGARRVWIDPQSTHDLTVLAEFTEQPVADIPDPRTVDESDLDRIYGLG